MPADVIYSDGRFFDIQLSEAKVRERKLGEIFRAAKIELIELKSENRVWEITGKIFIEYSCNGKPSGLAITTADYWVQELRRGDETLVYLMFPVERLKEICRIALARGECRDVAGDNGKTKGVLLKLRDIIC